MGFTEGKRNTELLKDKEVYRMQRRWQQKSPLSEANPGGADTDKSVPAEQVEVLKPCSTGSPPEETTSKRHLGTHSSSSKGYVG